jgi:hypothetical protein
MNEWNKMMIQSSDKVDDDTSKGIDDIDNKE